MLIDYIRLSTVTFFTNMRTGNRSRVIQFNKEKIATANANHNNHIHSSLGIDNIFRIDEAIHWNGMFAFFAHLSFMLDAGCSSHMTKCMNINIWVRVSRVSISISCFGLHFAFFGYVVWHSFIYFIFMFASVSSLDRNKLLSLS